MVNGCFKKVFNVRLYSFTVYREVRNFYKRKRYVYEKLKS